MFSLVPNTICRDMATLTIPDELLQRVADRLGKDGRANVEQHVLSMLEAFAMDGQPIDAETEKKLLEGLNSPIVSLDDAAWTAKIARYEKRNGNARGRDAAIRCPRRG